MSSGGQGMGPRPNMIGQPAPMGTGGYTPRSQFGGNDMRIPPDQGGIRLPGSFETGGLTPAPQAQAPQPGGIDPATQRPYGMQTLQGNAFNPAANQWGDYQQATGDGLWGTDANGINRVNGHVFAPSGLNSGNNDFSNWLNRFAPQFAQQNGQINRGQAQTWGPPPGMGGDIRGGSTGGGGMSGLGRNTSSFLPGAGTPGMPMGNGLGRPPMPPPFDPNRSFPGANPLLSNGPGAPPASPPPSPPPGTIDPRTGRPYGMKLL